MSLLMIPGPIEVSPAVIEASSGPPPGHLAVTLIEAFCHALTNMRTVWRAPESAQPFCIAGSGTIAMEMAVCNLVDPGARVLVVGTGYFSDRLAEMFRRRGAEVRVVEAPPGDAPTLGAIENAAAGVELIAATHVDTSTGVRTDAAGICRIANKVGALTVFDGVCATAAERFEMRAWEADCYLTASQKAIGLPAGLALMVVSERGMQTRARLKTPPPLSLDFEEWAPIMRAYEARGRSYFSTPATTLVRALDVGLAELVRDGMDTVFTRHQRAADGMRAAWTAYGLHLVPERIELAANTLSAIRYPAGVGPELPTAIGRHRVVVAGGLHPAIKESYFRVGHMGYSTTRSDHLERTVRAVGLGLRDCGYDAEIDAAVTALHAVLARTR